MQTNRKLNDQQANSKQGNRPAKKLKTNICIAGAYLHFCREKNTHKSKDTNQRATQQMNPCSSHH